MILDPRQEQGLQGLPRIHQVPTRTRHLGLEILRREPGLVPPTQADHPTQVSLIRNQFHLIHQKASLGGAMNQNKETMVVGEATAAWLISRLGARQLAPMQDKETMVVSEATAAWRNIRLGARQLVPMQDKETIVVGGVTVAWRNIRLGARQLVLMQDRKTMVVGEVTVAWLISRLGARQLILVQDNRDSKRRCPQLSP